MESWTIEGLIKQAAGDLRRSGSSSPRLDAELLLAKTLDLDRTQIFTQSDRTVDPESAERFWALIARRVAREPVAYILGAAYFRRLRLTVGPEVLIPRPETEELVDVALDVLRRRPAWEAQTAADGSVDAADAGSAPLVADVGTGSGAIALSLAQEAGLSVVATDMSAGALSVAAANAAAAGLAGLVDLRHADLLDGVPDGSLHLVVSNPPYVTSGDYADLAPDVRLYEPAGALVAGPDGLDVMRRLLPEAARALRPGGTVILEVGHDQAQAVAGLAVAAGFAFTIIHRDLSGKERIVEATLPGACVMGAGTPAPAGVPAAARRVAPARAPRAAAQTTVVAEPHWVARLRAALAAGAIIGVPTDTVYGIGARWDSAEGVKRLFIAKGRPAQQPVQVLFPSVDAIVQGLPDLAPQAAKVLAALLPGAFTFIVATGVSRPEMVGTPDSLGVRVPDHPPLQHLLGLLDVPLAATSANLSGCPDVRTLGDADPLVLAHCSVAFDPFLDALPGVCLPPVRHAGASPAALPPPAAGGPGRASTVVDLRPLTLGLAPVVLREGAVGSAEVLARIAAIVP